MRKAWLTAAPSLVLALASQAFAQGAPATPDSQSTPPAAAPRTGTGPGPGHGARGPKGGMGPRVGSDSVAGWSMMSRQERDAFHDRMLSARTAGECQAIVAEHRKLMEDRAAARGTTMRAPRRDPCARLPG